MIRPSFLRRWPLLVACLLCVRPALAEDPERLIPHDVAVYVEVSDAARIVDRVLAPDIVGMLESIPQYQQFSRSDQFAQLRSVVAYLETKLGTNWRKAIGDLTSGGAVFAIHPGDPDYILFVIRSKDADLLERTNRLLIEMVEQDARDKKIESPVKSKDYKGVRAWTLGKDEFHAILGDTLVLSNKQEGIKTALDMHMGSGPKSIADVDQWREAKSRALSGNVAWSFARLDVFRQAGFAKDLYVERPNNPAIPIFFGGLSHVLSRAPYATASLVVNDERLAFRAEVPRDGAAWPAPFRGFYTSRAGAEAAVPLRPARTIASLSFYRDFKAMWDVREQLVAAEALPGFTELESNAAPVLFGGREFSTEVLGEFEPRFRLVAAAQDYSKSRFVPDLKIPAFALVAELKHPTEFGTDLIIAFQSVLGLANVGFGQKSQPRLILANENYKGFEIQAAHFPERASKGDGPGVHLRHNFRPACTVAGRYFVLGSTVQIVKDVLDSIGDVQAAPATVPQNIVFEADVTQINQVLQQNRSPLVSQNMVSGGNTREQAEQEFDTLVKLLGLFGGANASWSADPNAMHVDVSVDFKGPQKSASR
jgi:hypothetical protein